MTFFQQIAHDHRAESSPILLDERLYRLIWQRLKFHDDSDQPLRPEHEEELHDIVMALETQYQWTGDKLHCLRQK